MHFHGLSCRSRRGAFLAAAGFSAIVAAFSSYGSGLYMDGSTGRSLALGGATTASGFGPTDALAANPATLSETQHLTLEITGNAGFAQGSFHNRANPDAKLGEQGLFASAAGSVSVGPLRFGLGILPRAALQAHWRYDDTPGGADGATTYGERAHESEIELLRTAAAVSWQITPQLSLGASVGLLYNQNRMDSPYIFQSQPTLRGAKTLLDLNTSGYGWNGAVGLVWKPTKTLQAGLSYTSRSTIKTHGTATGDAGTQLKNIGLGAARPDFSYDAEVTNVFPDDLSAGLAWQATQPLLLIAQFDWVRWQGSFDSLPVRLTNGNNDDLNALVGSDRLNDDIPLHWKDQYVIHLAAEYALDQHWTLRCGYSYAQNPVPGDTLTPLTAAIFEQTISAGVGFAMGPATIDLGWQWSLPHTAHTGKSVLSSGEYTDSSIRVGAQTLGLTTRVQF